MFIRKRQRKLKNGEYSDRYQVIETYREGGKVKQRVIVPLYWHNTPEGALQGTIKKIDSLNKFLIAYEQGTLPYNPRSRHWRQERADKYRKQLPQLEARVCLLKKVVSKMYPRGDNPDTTANYSQ